MQSDLERALPLLEFINESGPQLTQLSPGDGASKLEDIMKKDNKKYENLADQVKKRADKIQLQRKKSVEVNDAQVQIALSIDK